MIDGSQREDQGGGTPVMNQTVASRVAVIAAAVATIIGVLVVRLWFLQVVSAPTYAAAATKNRIHTLVDEPVRGIIVDRHNVPLVQNRAAQNVVMRPQEFKLKTREERRALLRRLSRITGVGEHKLRVLVHDGLKDNPSDDTVLAAKVDAPIVNYLSERRRDFPGIGLDTVYLRSYPNGALAAQIFGQVAPVFVDERQAALKKGIPLNARLGRSGLEKQYEAFLHGTVGKRQVEVEANGTIVGPGPVSTPAQQGDTLETSIDIPTNTALQNAIAVAVARTGAPGAAGVAMDVNTGQVLAIASVPSFDPKALVDGKTAAVDAITSSKRSPLLNRATESVFASGSTFKPFTLITGMEEGVLSPTELIDCPGRITLFDQEYKNFGFESWGPISLPFALQVSCDTYVDAVAKRIYKKYETTQDTPIQDWAKLFGYGSQTGIDLPGEAPGLVPDLRWKRTHNLDSPVPSARDWKPGDTINLALGQGDLQASPLQVAVSYAALANGGKLVTPTLARRLIRPDGSVERNFVNAVPPREIVLQDKNGNPKKLTPEILDPIKEGLFLVANGKDGTAYDVFHNIPEGFKVAGKTGTAENTIKGKIAQDHSWFVGYAPYDHPKIVVAVIIQNAGTGASAAAPVVCKTMASYLRFPVDSCGDGSGTQGKSH